MLRINAVFLKILKGSPTSFSFFIIWKEWFFSRTTPVAARRNFAKEFERD
jgi:hypothetical protein